MLSTEAMPANPPFNEKSFRKGLDELHKAQSSVARAFYDLAVLACDRRDPELVYRLVGNSRRAMQSTRVIEKMFDVTT